MILDRIVEKKREEIAALKRLRPLAEIRRELRDAAPARDFRGALVGKPCAIVAEVKRSSPSKGRFLEDFRPVEIARTYERSGAAAVSVLTEKHFFEGDGAYLTAIKEAVAIPVLRKDFIFDPYQIYESKRLGADALLLIAALFDTSRLGYFIALTEELGLTPLVEVHDREELGRALEAGARVIGINNRNLRTFVTDISTTVDLISEIKGAGIKSAGDRLVVSESGIASRGDIERLMAAGADAFLIGETLIRAGDIAGKMRELLGHG